MQSMNAFIMQSDPNNTYMNSFAGFNNEQFNKGAFT